jgi:hypothetical protein
MKVNQGKSSQIKAVLPEFIAYSRLFSGIFGPWEKRGILQFGHSAPETGALRGMGVHGSMPNVTGCHGSCHGSSVRKGPFLLICHGVTARRGEAPKCPMIRLLSEALAGRVEEAGDDDESSRKMHDRAFWDGWDGSWDGLGRTLGRIKHAKSSMFTGLGTVGRINWGGEGV